jgi:5-methylcytosine-specific restriction endonuclease McrBC GTP-binding regulatory subunit McrB
LVMLSGGQIVDDGKAMVCDTFKKSGRFGLPANLSIYGTMNSTDRSIQRLDSALRRRFDFVEVLPNPSLLSDNVALKEFLEKVNIALELRKPGSGCQIGHAWLMMRGVAIPPSSVRLLCEAFNNKIFPLLSEWFWDDPDGLMKMFGGASALVDQSSRRIRNLVEEADEKAEDLMTPEIFLQKFKEKYKPKNT